jgi:CspA family cold shock protein
MQGTVKWFNIGKGFGFIKPNGGGRDVFVHIRAVEAAGLYALSEGQAVEYQIVTGGDGRPCAEHLKVQMSGK